MNMTPEPETPTTSYYAMIRAGQGFLLGGVKIHRSSRFESLDDALAFMEQCVETNEGAGRNIAVATVLGSALQPEIPKQ